MTNPKRVARALAKEARDLNREVLAPRDFRRDIVKARDLARQVARFTKRESLDS